MNDLKQKPFRRAKYRHGLRVVQYWRLVSTRKAHLSIRTSRTGRLMYSRVVVDPWIHSVKCEFWHLHIPHIVVLVERGIFILPCAFHALFLVERGIFILPCAFHALFLVERGILILSCAFRESVMIFTDRQRLVNTLDDSYDSYEWTSQLYESIQVVSIGHSCRTDSIPFYVKLHPSKVHKHNFSFR